MLNQKTTADVPFAFEWDIGRHFLAADKHILEILRSPKMELNQYVIDYLTDFMREFKEFDDKLAKQRGAAYKVAGNLVDLNGLAMFNETFNHKGLREGFGWSEDTLRIFKSIIHELNVIWRKIKTHYYAYKF